VRRRSNPESDSTVLAPLSASNTHHEGKVAIGVAETITPSGPWQVTADSQASVPLVVAPVAVEATLSGRVVGDYVLGDVIGSGGMGVIYTATDSKLQRKVAIKVIHAHLDTNVADYASSRLVREAQAMAKLSHPNVVTIFQVGTIEDRVYIAMEFVDGQTIAQWLEKTRPGWQKALDVFVEAGRGLQAAHAAGLIHRDFKPDNVLIGQDGRVLVTDFGLARPTLTVEPAAPQLATTIESMKNLSLTQTGAIMGTPLYMSPEQHQGLPTDARSDQYSFCVALYEAVYGQLPFEGTDLWQLAGAKLEGKIRPPPEGSRVPRWLRALLLRGLRPSRSERFPQLEDILTAIKRRRTRRRELVAVAGVAVVLAGVGGVLFANRSNVDPVASCKASGQRIASLWNSERNKAVQAAFAATSRTDAKTTASYVASVLDAYSTKWSSMHLDACTATRGRHEQSEALLDRRMSCLNRRAEELGATVDLFVAADAAVVGRAPDAVNRLGRIEDCAATDAMVAAASVKVTPQMREQADRLSKDLSKAKALASSSHLDDGLAVANRIAAEAKALGDALTEAEALSVLARIQAEKGKYAEEKDTLVRASAAGERAGDAMLRVSALVELVYVDGFELGNFAEGRVWARLASEQIERAAGMDQLRGLLLRNEAAIFFAEGNFEKAKAKNEEALELQRRVLGPDHVDVAYTLDQLGGCEVMLGKPLEAIEYHRAAIAIYSKLGEKNVHVADSMNNLGTALAESNDLDGAAAEYQRALEIWRLGGSENANVATAYTNLGALAFKREDYEGALREYTHALTILETAFGTTHRTVAAVLTSIGIVHMQRNAPTDAIPQLERALAIFETMTPPPIEEANTRFTLARALWATDRRRALELAHTARSRLANAGQGWADTLTYVDSWLAEREK
jgi:eukaryotic-like serine/threonine-protein kinase